MATVKLGSYDTQIQADLVSTVKTYSASVKIPWQFPDFRNQDPYTSILLYLPAYGFISINPNDVIGQDSIQVTATIDGLTGRCVYNVGSIMRVDCDLGVDIMVGTVTNNSVGMAQGTAQMALATGTMAVSALTGNMLGVVAGAGMFAHSTFNTYLASQERNLGSVGGNTGMAGILSQVYNLAGGYVKWNNIVCVTISHDTSEYPYDIVDTIGLPCNQILQLSQCTGYTQTSNASVNCVNEEISNTINKYLNGGVYIE